MCEEKTTSLLKQLNKKYPMKNLVKTKPSLTEEAYNPPTILSSIATTKSMLTNSYISTPEKVTISNSQINKLAYDKMDSAKRSRLLQIACESPDIIHLFHKRKLFANGDDFTSPFIRKTVRTNPTEIKLKNNKAKYTRNSKDGHLKRFDYSNNDIKDAMNELKSSNKYINPHKIRYDSPIKTTNDESSHSKGPLSGENHKEKMCIVLKNIVKNCEHIRNNSKSNEKIDFSIEKEQKIIKNMTDRMQWTSSKLEK